MTLIPLACLKGETREQADRRVEAATGYRPRTLYNLKSAGVLKKDIHYIQRTPRGKVLIIAGADLQDATNEADTIPHYPRDARRAG